MTVDLTRVLEAGMPVYPGDPPVRFTAHAGLETDGYRVARVEFGTHAGTHLDAPAHFLPAGAGVEALALERLIGPARVLPHPRDGDAASPVVPGERLLIVSGWDQQWGQPEYFETFPGLPEAFVQQLEAAPAALIGLETPSLHPDPAVDADYHRRLLGAGVIVVENLVGVGALPAEVMLAALPLPLRGLDGAPCRVVAMIGDA